jgi:hypothetical protein
MELTERGFDVEGLKVFLLNLVLSIVRENQAGYDYIKDIDPIDFAEGILRSAVMIDEASKLKAMEAQEKMAKKSNYRRSEY